MVWNTYGLMGLLLALCSVNVAAQQIPTPMKEDSVHVRTWNRFVDELLQLHKSLTEGRAVTVSRKSGGYATHPDFYIEEEYRDDKGRLISRVQWEKRHPDRVHVIEVYLHDRQGRVIRDYVGAYLPDYRNAPTQTLITLHGYNGKLHAFRTFDASGDLLYERCEGQYRGKPADIRLEFDDIYAMEGKPNTTLTSKPYLACFKGIQKTAGKYLQPQ
jgi:hypothetical protein